MISRKALNKTTQILAVLLVMLFIGLTIYQKHLIKKAARNDDTRVSMNDGDTTPDASESERRESLKQQRVELQRTLAEDPAVREAIRSSIENQYVAFFQEIDLSPEKQEKLESLLENSAVDYLVLNPDILTAVTEEEKASVQRRYDYLRKETLLKAEALLGADDYKNYEAYENRAVARGVVEGFEKSLTPEDSLTDQQTSELIDVMYRETQEVYSEIGYDPTNRVVFPSEMDTAAISERMELTDRILSNAAESSKGILSASQLEQYRKYIDAYSEEQEMSLVMMNQQFGE